jgi:hypothetical protein
MPANLCLAHWARHSRQWLAAGTARLQHKKKWDGVKRLCQGWSRLFKGVKKTRISLALSVLLSFPSFLPSLFPSFFLSFVRSFVRSFLPSLLPSFVRSFVRLFVRSFLFFFFLFLKRKKKRFEHFHAAEGGQFIPVLLGLRSRASSR